MPLVSAKPSLNALPACESALRHLIRAGRVSRKVEVCSELHPIYVLGADKIQAGHPGLLSDSQLRAWRYFARDGSNETVAFDVSLAPWPRVTSLRYGQQAKAAYDHHKCLHALPAVQPDDFEPRLLRVTGSLFEAFWLKALKQPDDAGLFYHLKSTFAAVPPDNRQNPTSINAFLMDMLAAVKVAELAL